MWTHTTLGELCKMYQPKTISAKEMVADGDYVVFGANGIIGRYDKYNHEEPQLLVTCRGATCGAVNVSEPFSWINGNAMVIQPDFEKVSLKYMEYLFRGGINLSTAITGAAQPQITRKSLEPIQFSYPPLPEQERIVAKLDAVFAEIDKKKLAQKIKIENIISFEQNILKAALVKVDADNHNYNLQQLLEMNWIESHLDGNHGADYPRENEFVQSGVPYIAANCLSDNAVMMNKSKYLSHERAAKLRKGIAKNGDVLFAHNATVGPTAILETNEEKVILGTSLTYYRCNKKFINNEYLLAFMRSENFIKQYQDVMRQATRNQVPITKQRTFTFLIPPLDIQLEVVKKVNSFSQLIAEVANQTRLAHDLLDNLRLAILSQEQHLREAA